MVTMTIVQTINEKGLFENILEITARPNGLWSYVYKKNGEIIKLKVRKENIFDGLDKNEIKNVLEEKLKLPDGWYRVHKVDEKYSSITLFDGRIGGDEE